MKKLLSTLILVIPMSAGALSYTPISDSSGGFNLDEFSTAPPSMTCRERCRTRFFSCQRWCRTLRQPHENSCKERCRLNYHRCIRVCPHR